MLTNPLTDQHDTMAQKICYVRKTMWCFSISHILAMLGSVGSLYLTYQSVNALASHQFMQNLQLLSLATAILFLTKYLVYLTFQKKQALEIYFKYDDLVKNEELGCDCVCSRYLKVLYIPLLVVVIPLLSGSIGSSMYYWITRDSMSVFNTGLIIGFTIGLILVPTAGILLYRQLENDYAQQIRQYPDAQKNI